MAETLRWVAPPGAPRLDRALADAFPHLSRARLQALIAEGRVTVDGVPGRASARPESGQQVLVDVPDPTPTLLVPEQVDLDVLFEDDDLIVVNKPAGMPVHPSAGHTTGTLVHALLGRVGPLSSIGGVERPGIVHRLDAGTSGVLVVARNDIAHRALAAMFAAHDIDRRYLAVVHRIPLHDGGTLRSELARDPKDRLKIASVVDPRVVDDDDEDEIPTEPAVRRRGRLAVTHWRVRSRGDRIALLECRLETGRTHQVRVHLSEAGHPIVGDVTYARRDRVAPASVRPVVEALTHPLLHAWSLALRHPRDGRPLAFAVPPPADYLAVCALAGLTVPSAPAPWR